MQKKCTNLHANWELPQDFHNFSPVAPDNVTPVASAGAAGERITPSGPDSCQISYDGDG